MGITINISNSEKLPDQKLDKISGIKKLLLGILIIGILFVFLIIILIIIIYNKKKNNNNENANKIGYENIDKKITDNLGGNEELKITIEDLYNEIKLLKNEIEEIKNKINETIERQEDNLNKRVADIEKILNSITPIYRLYYYSNGDHFYTSTIDERERAIRIGYTYEGVYFYAFPNNYTK